MTRRWRLFLLVLGLLAVATGCEVRVDVAVDADAEGSGEVRVAVGLDEAAAALVPDLASQLELGDLRHAGWTITGPARERDGVTWVRATKGFSSPAEAGAVMSEVSGPDGPFRDFSLRRQRSGFSERISFTGTVDLSAGLDAFADDALREEVGRDLGDLADQIRRDADVAVRDAFRFRVAALLPGSIQSNAPTEVDGGVVWTPSLGETASLSATGESVRAPRVAMAVAFGASIAGLAGLAVVRWRRHRAHLAS